MAAEKHSQPRATKSALRGRLRGVRNPSQALSRRTMDPKRRAGAERRGVGTTTSPAASRRRLPPRSAQQPACQPQAREMPRANPKLRTRFPRI